MSASDNTGSQAVRSVTNVSRRGLTTVSEQQSRQQESASYSNAFRMDNHDVVRIPPRERDYIPYASHHAFYSPDPHFFGYRVEVLPPRYRTVRYFGVDYYYYNNCYYRPYGGHYVICRPPFGVVVERATLADVIFAAVTFSFYNNVYRTYTGFDSYSRYIDQQNRQIAQNNAILARQNSMIAMNLSSAQDSYTIASRLGLAQSYAYANQQYFYQDGVFYIINSRGQYQVIVPPAGALVDELPDDYAIITLGGTEYYRVDDTVYRVVLVGGRPYLEVLGQMYGTMASRYSLF